MSKKIISAFLVLGLLVAFSGPAVAKKKKGPKPYTSEEATINVGHPVFYGNSGTLLSATAQEFLNSCAIPQSNGVDAYVYEIPADYAKLSSAAIQAFGSEGSQVAYDLDLFLYDSSCANVGVFNSTSVDESGVITVPTAFVLLYNYTGDPVSVHFELKPLKPLKL
jgi:hypothetical protein